MKKNFFAALLLCTAVFLRGASVWEGAAAVSVDFPESGLYVATNSFPRNTVIDLTNLETGKTVRVIVAAGLDSPGLLALVSREAADAIGLRARSIGRIRMIAPQDPIAFSRFSGDEFLSGDPDFDPLAAVEGVYGKGSTSPAATTPLTPAPTAPTDPPPVAVEPPAPIAPLPTTPLPTTPPPPAIIPPPAVTEPSMNDAVTSGAPLRSEPDSYWDDPASVFFVEDDTPETNNAVAITTVDPFIYLPDSTVPVPVSEPEPAPQPVLPPPPVAPPPAPPPAPDYNYTLIPAEERPPYGMTETPSVYVPPKTAVLQTFSVPAVAELESGKYYLQLGVYSHIPVVEQELTKIECGYPLTVQCINLSGKPAYRVLVGPVNQGEAGALLKRFQAGGYKDAFVRRG